MYLSVWFSVSAATYRRGQSLHQERQERRDLHGSGHHVSSFFYMHFTKLRPIYPSCAVVLLASAVICPSSAMIFLLVQLFIAVIFPLSTVIFLPSTVICLSIDQSTCCWVLVVDHVLFCPHSYSSDCDLMVKLKGMNMGIKDLQVGVR